VAWDASRGDWRTFRADRITPRPPAGPRFTPRELPGDVTDHVMRGVSGAAWRYRARVTVHAPAGQISERINPAVGTVEPVDEHTCILDTGADTIETLAVYLGLLGADFTVTEPPELVEYVRVLSRRYQSATQ
jgi:predicted DNA-binding transcriptional regulator YafY